MYRKQTYTGLGIHFLSSCSKQFKRNIFNTLFHRAYTLSSDFKLFHTEIEFLKTFFVNNGFNINQFYTFLRCFLNKKLQTVPKHYGPSRMVLYSKLPYLNDHVNDMCKAELNQLFLKYFPQVKLNLIFFNNYKIKSFFKYKDNLPKSLCSSLVYSFKCSNCQFEYIGSTQRTLKLRADEHKGISSRTGRHLSRPLSSSIRDHTNMCQSIIEVNDFRVLYNSKYEQELRFAESILIKIRKPSLNQDGSSAPLALF